MSEVHGDEVLLKALTKFITAYAPLKGEDYYEALSRYVVENFEFEYAFVGKINDNITAVDVISGWAKDKPITTFSYNLENTPCDKVVSYDYEIHPKDVQKLYPNDQMIKSMGVEAYSGIALTNKDQAPVGIFVAISKKPFKNPQLVEHILKLCAGFLSAEMQRYAVELSTKNLKNIAYYDPLTKLPNRLLITDRIARAIANQSREKNIVAICLLDLDGFKDVNDTLGHDAGDYVLIEVARRIEDLIRPEDTVARLGGDEFVIVLSDIDTSEDAGKVLVRVLNAVAAPYNFKNKLIKSISASIGVAIYPEDNVDDDTLIRHADQAMYKAKNSGKNQFRFFDAKEHVKVKANFKALKKIEKAIDNGEFQLYYQPKLSAHNLKVESFEVLSRWVHPVLGVLSPSEFLPLIENDDLMYKFDEWVIRESLLGVEKLKKEGINVYLSVNISPKQFKQTNFVGKVKNIVTDMGIDPSYLKQIEFEITENTALESITHTNETMFELNSMGVSFALDDFGTGYSSLTHLKQLNVNTIKIDRSFIDDMLHDSQDMAIVNAIISLSKVFQIEVVAEGAENIEQLLMLLELGCDSIQGYTIAKPMSYEATLIYMKNFTSDPRWKVVTKNIPRRADFELLLAESNHKYWAELVIDSISRDNYKNIPQLSYNSCRLGKWMHNNGKVHFSKYGSFHELKTIHKNIHKEVGLIIEKLSKGASEEEREKSIEKIVTMRNKLVSAINKLEIEYKEDKGIKQ
ncbi:EAL domain-containing protein [Sulfurimonas sp.]|uniref:EAL domain-containing protein n=1 Tax=Sulfurimonas sp. TaxID=2022749 RepID=UPI0035642FD1